LRVFKRQGFAADITRYKDDEVSDAELYTEGSEFVPKTLKALAVEGIPPCAGKTMADLVVRCLDNNLVSETNDASIVEAFSEDVFEVFRRLLAVI